MISCKLNITATTFHDAKILTYGIDLSPDENKMCLNLLDNEYFTIPYIIGTITNSPAGHQLPTQAKKNVLTIAIKV